MKFQTKIPLQSQQHNQIDYNSSLLLLGSCFVENISEKLDYFKFQNAINPFGILFHPKAIETFITNAINEKEFLEDDVFFQDEHWHCFDAHSRLNSTSKPELLNSLNENIQLANQQIYKSTHLIITLGTSWVYRFIEDDTVVANCHKVSQKRFLKELLSVDDVTHSLQAIIALIKQENPQVTIIFTVSPIRHIKDGFVKNTLSKSHLVSGIHQVINNRENVFYFPSYEIMMDELRDYRFYAEDMIHPNKTAINYIWEKFQEVWISQEALITMDEVKTVQKGLLHKPFNPDTKQHQMFLENLKDKQKKLSAKFPSIIF